MEPTPERGTSPRDLEFRALTRDVILGTLVVIVVSLAVPVLLIRAEYQRSHLAPTPAAEVLRERISGTASITPSAPSIADIPKLAEQLVRREAEKRAAPRSRVPHGTDERVDPASSGTVPHEGWPPEDKQQSESP